MKISELKPGQSKVDVEATVSDVGETRTFSRFGRVIRVATATIQDDSGSMKMSLWNEDIDRVKKGAKIKVTNGFVKEFQGESQLTSGKFGKIEVLEEGEAKPAEEGAEAEAEAKPEKKEEKVEEEKVEEAGKKGEGSEAYL